MRQDYLFVNKHCTEIFSVVIDEDDEKSFKKGFMNNIRDIIKRNRVVGPYKIINLTNAADKEFSGQQTGGAENDDDDSMDLFRGEMAEMRNYLYTMQPIGIDEKVMSGYYTNLSKYAEKIGIGKDEFNKIFMKELQ